MVTRAGFSLVEVIVALTLLSVGILGVAAGGILATRLLRAAELQETVTNDARALLDSLLEYNVIGAGSDSSSRYRVDWTAGRDTVAVMVNTRSESFALRALR